jgi:hypothetical protein
MNPTQGRIERTSIMTAPKYRDIYAELFGKAPSRAAGVPEGQVEQAEKRLGVKIPAALRSFYRSVGRVEGIASGYQHLVAPEDLQIGEGRLLFLVENQAVCAWGIEPSGDDPEVEQGEESEPHAWEKIGQSASSFLEMLIYMQMAWGGSKHIAYHFEPATVLDRIRTSLELVVDNQGALIFRRGEILLSHLEGNGFLMGAARTEAGLAILVEEFGFSE